MLLLLNSIDFVYLSVHFAAFMFEVFDITERGEMCH